jgi:hypothetical protein
MNKNAFKKTSTFGNEKTQNKQRKSSIVSNLSTMAVLHNN